MSTFYPLPNELRRKIWTLAALPLRDSQLNTDFTFDLSFTTSTPQRQEHVSFIYTCRLAATNTPDCGLFTLVQILVACQHLRRIYKGYIQLSGRNTIYFSANLDTIY